MHLIYTQRNNYPKFIIVCQEFSLFEYRRIQPHLNRKKNLKIMVRFFCVIFHKYKFQSLIRRRITMKFLDQFSLSGIGGDA